MRSEFEKLFKSQRSYRSSDKEAFIRGCEAAFKHQQSKVDELQKRVDAVKQLIEEYRDPPTEDKTFQHALSIVAYELEQALKGGSDE
jgi:cell fate (sporulation/competence/biofilm development) regulator YmcA (YheA/YmcA/DUF963 family)